MHTCKMEDYSGHQTEEIIGVLRPVGSKMPGGGLPCERGGDAGQKI